MNVGIVLHYSVHKSDCRLSDGHPGSNDMSLICHCSLRGVRRLCHLNAKGMSNLHRIQKVIFERLRFCGMQKLTLDILTLARKLNLKWIIGFSMLLDIVTTRLTFLLKQLNNNNNKCWSAKEFYFSLLFSLWNFLFWHLNQTRSQHRQAQEFWTLVYCLGFHINLKLNLPFLIN